jgi:GTP-binding protein YchF
LFEDSDITHVSGTVDPTRDINVINLELVLADLEVATKRRAGIERDAKSGKKEALVEKVILDKVISILEAGKLARTAQLTPEELFVIKSLNLLTLKPMMYVLNRKASGHNVDDHADDKANALQQFLEDAGAGVVRLDAGVEHELKDIAHDDAEEFRREFDVLESGVDALIAAGYRLLNLMSFYTTGKKESRAWTIVRGSTAPEAGAAIHTDFKDKFIRADVINWEKLLQAGSWPVARDNGLVRTEGKEYIVQEGDVMEFKHS